MENPEVTSSAGPPAPVPAEPPRPPAPVVRELFSNPDGEHLARGAITYWAMGAAGIALAALVVGLLIRAPLQDLTWLPDALAELPWIAALAGGAMGALAVPPLRWRRWRYRVRETDVEVWHGNLFRHRAIVPMNRVQHVEVESGPLMRRLDLATVTIFTAAGSVVIPAVGDDVAEALRTRIAELARLIDE